jgi:predicted AAA+ superfamily ATPase
MIPRPLTAALTSALAEAPAVALLGPPQVGKTTLALELAQTRPAVYLDLELFSCLRGLIDAGRIRYPELAAA